MENKTTKKVNGIGGMTFDQFRTKNNLVVALQTTNGHVYIGQPGDIHVILAARIASGQGKEWGEFDLFDNVKSCGFWMGGRYWEEQELRQVLNLN